MSKAVVFAILALSLLALPIIHVETGVSGPRAYSLGSLGSTDYPWTMFRGNALRTGATAASGPGSNNPMWSFPTSGLLYSSPAVADGLVFISSWDGNVYAIDEFSGVQKWVFSSYQYVSSSPAVSNGLVYFTTACPTAGSGPFTCTTGSAYALDEQTGGVVWRVIAEPMTSSPVIADGRVFYGSIKVGNGHLYARYVANGNGNWTQPLTDSVESSPSVHNGRVFVGQLDGAVVALNENTGLPIWRVVPGDNVQTALAVGSGMVYVATLSSGLFALNENTGGTVWSFPTGGLNVTSVSLNAGRVYFGTGGGTVYSLNATTGVQIWARALGGAIASSPALALGSGTLYMGSNDHRLYSLSMTTGIILWSYLAGSNVVSSPAVADGRVFFGSQDRSVYALGTVAAKLQATISASVRSLKPGGVSTLTMTVKNGTIPVSGATLTLTVTPSSGGSVTQPSMTSPGTYTANFTSQPVTSLTNTTVQVVANRSGFVAGSNQTSILVIPLLLTVSVVPTPPSASPGGNIVLDISVSNGTQMVTGANITLSSSAGGSFSKPTDAGNGKYSVVFSSTLQSSSPTITVNASKSGFSGQSQVTVTISGFPDLITYKVVGVPLLFFLLGIALLSIMIIVALARRRQTESMVKPEPLPPAYVMRRGFSFAKT